MTHVNRFGASSIQAIREALLDDDVFLEALSTALGGGLLSATVNLTAAQSRNLFTTPQVVVPAPGAGKVIIVHGGAICYTFVSAAASVVPDPYYIFSYDGAHDGNTHFATSLLSLTVDSVSVIAPDGRPPALAESAIANKALTIVFPSADATGGDGTLEITVRYSIIDM